MAMTEEEPQGVPILLAEDDEVSREILTAQLKAWGHQVESCSEGMQAIMALRRKDGPQIAILDWNMPGMEGPAICRRLRQADKNLYLIILTSRTRKEEMIEALDAGADDYLTKPCDPDELYARIRVGIRITKLQGMLEIRIAELEHPDYVHKRTF